MTGVLIAGEGGVTDLQSGQVLLSGRHLSAICLAGRGGWAVFDDDHVARLGPDLTVQAEIGRLTPGSRATCLAPQRAGVFIGTSEGSVWHVDAAGTLARDTGFDEAPGRKAWYTPWGDPAQVRSIAVTEHGDVLVNVHVGGILRSGRSGAGDDSPDWSPTIDIDADVHQVVAGPGPVAVAASAVGMWVSVDDGRTWSVETDFLHTTYARAVCVAADHMVMSVSDGPDGGRAALYRRRAGSHTGLLKCTEGLPEWFPDNIDTGCLAADGRHVAFATSAGELWTSPDCGASWTRAAHGLPPPIAVLIG